VSTRNALILVVVTAALSALLSFTLAAGSLHRGPAGDPGPEGPPGPPGDTRVSARDVGAAIEADTGAVADALTGHLDYADVQKNLDPDPADLEREVRDLTDRLDTLCSDLSASDAGGVDVTTCEP
jgi:hypothetical protein